MAARRPRRTAARRRRAARLKGAFAGGALPLALLIVYGSTLWPYVLGALAAAALAATAAWLWRTDRGIRRGDRQWRAHDRISAGRRTLPEIDAMTGEEFEEHVARLLRRDGCTDVHRVGRSGDHGVDVTARLPDGRLLITQCKRYAPSRRIAERDMRDLLGARTHTRADVAAFVTTAGFSGPSLAYARQNGLIAVHRDYLGTWNNGATLEALGQVNGAGQGDRRHRRRWKHTYGR
ncbi:restriction endonuclease [Streptomyces sp. NPDC004134]|uniref:restriction endonuclease n=1 Tax=Streptomyces sp. NPDC004134 TaxID=3364691 RepID=UPI0036B0A285